MKCPKCGKEYDSMYSFHSCKEEKRHKDKEGGVVKYIAGEVCGAFWVFMVFFLFLLLGGFLYKLLSHILPN